MSIRHSFDRPDVDLAVLRAELSTRLGRRVELLTSAPTVDEPAGVLIVEDPETGDHLDVDPALVSEVVVAHQPPLSEDEQAIAEFDAATTVVGRLQVWRDWLGRRVSAESLRRERARLVLDRVRETDRRR